MITSIVFSVEVDHRLDGESPLPIIQSSAFFGMPSITLVQNNEAYHYVPVASPSFIEQRWSLTELAPLRLELWREQHFHGYE
jgi:hypothetical protein